MDTGSRTKASLAAENELLKAIIDAVPVGVTANDAEGRFILVNKAAEKLNSIRREDVLGIVDRDIFGLEATSAQDDGTWLNYVAKSSKEPILDVPVDYEKPDGSRQYTIMSTYPFLQKGVVTSTFCIASNLQEPSQMTSLPEKYSKISKPKTGLAPNRTTRYSFDDFLTENPETKSMLAMAKRAAGIDLPIMIIGETGTGKEIIAQGIHHLSDRRDAPFVPINCAAIPDGLVESIFFGTVKGAFTGASDMAGLFEQANGGTLFLDEVNSLPSSFQPKLLRALQEKSIRRVGGNAEKSISFRLICAANQDLTNGESWSAFRQDLLYRLAVMVVRIPPLRERSEDVALLAQAALTRLEPLAKRQGVTIAPSTLAMLGQYSWPGNVRELDNAIASAMTMLEEDQSVILPGCLPEKIQLQASLDPVGNAANAPFAYGCETAQSAPLPTDGKDGHPADYADYAGRKERKRTTMEEEKGRLASSHLADKVDAYERFLIEQALAESKGNVSNAADKLGIHRTNLYAKMKKLNVGRAQ